MVQTRLLWASHCPQVDELLTNRISLALTNWGPSQNHQHSMPRSKNSDQIPNLPRKRTPAFLPHTEEPEG
eukprot:3852630-Pyramimonas_sp.AAC.1